LFDASDNVRHFFWAKDMTSLFTVLVVANQPTKQPNNQTNNQQQPTNRPTNNKPTTPHGRCWSSREGKHVSKAFCCPPRCGDLAHIDYQARCKNSENFAPDKTAFASLNAVTSSSRAFWRTAKFFNTKSQL